LQREGAADAPPDREPAGEAEERGSAAFAPADERER
jgi:hypothetical protein